MKVLIVLAILYFCLSISNCTSKSPNTESHQANNTLDSLLTPISILESAFANQQNNITVTVKGVITKILSDDTVGGRHQRFIIQMTNSQTLLIAHNIDIAPRVSGINIGSIIYAHGEYVWNSQGGLVHWTHHDPDGVHENGWIIFEGTKYQ